MSTLRVGLEDTALLELDLLELDFWEELDSCEELDCGEELGSSGLEETASGSEEAGGLTESVGADSLPTFPPEPPSGSEEGGAMFSVVLMASSGELSPVAYAGTAVAPTVSSKASVTAKSLLDVLFFIMQPILSKNLGNVMYFLG